MRRTPSFLVLPASAALLLAACGDDAAPPAADDAPTAPAPANPTGEADATATLVDPEGSEVGTVDLTGVDGGTRVAAEISGMPPGFHGFHVHAVGLCEPDSADPTDPTMTGDFLSAGGHVGADETGHGEHAGDLTSLYVTDAGEGVLVTVTDAFAPADLLDDDGSALMVHENADNFANIPERYAPQGIDEVTSGTGDAGARLACGVVE